MELSYFLITIVTALLGFNCLIGFLVVLDFTENYSYPRKTLWKIFFLWPCAFYLEIKGDLLREEKFFPEN